jgi:hypothetical protein
MLFDTGSAVIYAMSDRCMKIDCPEDMVKLDTRSTSLVDKKIRQELNYGQGYVSGSIANEDICLSEVCLSQVNMLVGD